MPSLAGVRAAIIPAIPPPATKTVRGLSEGVMMHSASRPTAGLRRHVICGISRFANPSRQPFIAAAAAVDLVYAAVTDLVHKFRISKLGTTHGDHVNQVVFQNFLGKIGIVYAADPGVIMPVSRRTREAIGKLKP